jgi:hypothetical protein
MTDLAPPTIPPQSASVEHLQEPAKWPKVVGIISIVWGSLGLVCTTCGVAQGALGQFAISLAPADKQEEIKAQMADQPPIQKQGPADYALMAARYPLAAIVLIAGIMTLRRVASGRTLHIVYAITAFALSLIGWIVFAVLKFPAHQEWLKSHPDVQGAQFMTTPMILLFGLVFTVIVLAYPTFCLIWFGLLKKRPEAGWIEPELDAI